MPGKHANQQRLSVWLLFMPVETQTFVLQQARWLHRRNCREIYQVPCGKGTSSCSHLGSEQDLRHAPREAQYRAQPCESKQPQNAPVAVNSCTLKNFHSLAHWHLRNRSMSRCSISFFWYLVCVRSAWRRSRKCPRQQLQPSRRHTASPRNVRSYRSTTLYTRATVASYSVSYRHARNM